MPSTSANESMALALVAALQHLPPRQRAVLVLRDVLGLPPDEVADILGTTELSVKGTLQRARATLRKHLPESGKEPAPGPRSSSERETAGRFAAAVENGNVDAILTLLTEDAWLTMPPEPYEYQGRAAIGRFLVDRAQTPRRQLPTRADLGQPPACLRLLPPRHPRRGRPGLRAHGAHPQRRPHLCHHVVQRPEPDGDVRFAPHHLDLAPRSNRPPDPATGRRVTSSTHRPPWSPARRPAVMVL